MEPVKQKLAKFPKSTGLAQPWMQVWTPSANYFGEGKQEIRINPKGPPANLSSTG